MKPSVFDQLPFFLLSIYSFINLRSVNASFPYNIFPLYILLQSSFTNFGVKAAPPNITGTLIFSLLKASKLSFIKAVDLTSNPLIAMQSALCFFCASIIAETSCFIPRFITS